MELGEHVVEDAVLELVIQLQTWTATTCGIDHTRTSAPVRRSRTHVETRTSSSAISVPSPTVSPTFAIVKTTVRSSVFQKTGSERTLLKFASPMYEPWPWISSNSPYLLERELDEVEDRVAENRPEHEDDRCEQQVRDGAAGQAAARQAAAAATGWSRRRAESAVGSLALRRAYAGWLRVCAMFWLATWRPA